MRNGVATIGRAVRSALAQTGVGPLEVIVADGDSGDGTRAVVSEIAHADSRVRLVGNPQGKTPTGLNRAILESVGDVIVRCDAQSELPSDYVASAIDTLVETGADVVGGVQHAVGDGFWQRAVAMGMSTPAGVGDARFHFGGAPGEVDTVYLGVFRRSTLRRVGLYDESLERNQDYELNYRVRSAPGRVYFDPKLVVNYSPRTSLAALSRQYFDYGAWKRLVLRRFPASLRWRQLAPPLLIVGLIASLGFLIAGWRQLALVVPTAYGMLVGATTLMELVRRRDLAALGLPLVLPTMHLSWALGFMVGDVTDTGPSIPRLDES